MLGRLVSNLITPAGVLRPNSVPCGPRSTSIRSRSNSGMPLTIGFSMTTSSTTIETGCEAFRSKSLFPRPRM